MKYFKVYLANEIFQKNTIIFEVFQCNITSGHRNEIEGIIRLPEPKMDSSEAHFHLDTTLNLLNLLITWYLYINAM